LMAVAGAAVIVSGTRLDPPLRSSDFVPPLTPFGTVPDGDPAPGDAAPGDAARGAVDADATGFGVGAAAQPASAMAGTTRIARRAPPGCRSLVSGVAWFISRSL
jgi:hypothetical protein